ncbi:MAG: RtcB family protein [Myxococcales bacterium]|nr:RtcB family protein [Myxococcales bacterium]
MPADASLSPSACSAPQTARLITGPGVWMESDATAQLAATLKLAGCVRAVGMPDLHPGSGHPIGAAVATRGVVHPHLIGGDAGCGARLVVTTVERMDADRLERRINDAFDEDLLAAADPAALFAAAWHHGARGLAEVEGLPEGLRKLASREPAVDELPVSGDLARYRGFERSLGTIGGGNHFAEVTRVTSVADSQTAATLGLVRNALVVLAHSGSRGLGTELGLAWSGGPTDDDARPLPRFLGELAGACRFARANRLILTYRLLVALGALRDHTLRGGFDIVHNDVREEQVEGASAWVHRKGVAPAYAGAPTIVLGSRGAPSWILRGTGAEHGLCSVAHGAGRRMTRAEATAKLKHRYRRAELARAALGGRTICDDSALLYEEHPDAYKAIEPVISALEQAKLATRVAALTPVVTVKRA